MPELPEIASRAAQMNAALAGKTIQGIEVLQPKCLNLPTENFILALSGAQIQSVSYRGKWLFFETTRGWLLLNLGMGGETLLVTRAALPDKYRLVFDFSDLTALAVNFWWFGYAHFAALDALSAHAMTSALGPNAIDLTPAEIKALLRGQRSRLKTFLLDQSKVAGIGNFYIHDILFRAHLHPMRPIQSLSDPEIEALAQAIQDGLRPSLQKGGAFYELDLYGQKGGFLSEDLLVGYRENQPCPVCAAPIVKIKTGSTSSFICPTCQAVSG